MSLSCPWCYKRVTLDDLIVRDTCWTSKVQTCGRIVVERRATLVASHIEARSGMTILGVVEGKLYSGGAVVIGPRAHVKGDLEAPSVDIASGASIEGGFFKISSPRSADKPRSAGFIRPGGAARPTAGSQVLPGSTPSAQGGQGRSEIRPVVRVPEWIKRRLRTS